MTPFDETPSLRAIGLGKCYGSKWALQDCSFSVPQGHVTALVGPNGAGKTTLTKGIASGFGAAAEEEITSPTFTLIHRYSGAKVPVYHIDLYRIEGARDLDTLGLDDVFTEDAVVIIEWPDRMPPRHDWPILHITLAHSGEDARHIEITPLQ